METEHSAEALSDFLRAVRQTRDPLQSTRVAKALRRVVVRDLDRVVIAALTTAPSALYNADGEHRATGETWRATQLAVSTAALCELRPSPRSSCLAGCVAYVSGDFGAAVNRLSSGLQSCSDDAEGAWLRLNLAAALSSLGNDRAAVREYEASAQHGGSGPVVAGRLFALLLSLKVELPDQSSSRLSALFDYDPRRLMEELEQIARMYRAKMRRTGRDALEEIRPRLRELDARGRFLESTLSLSGV